MCSKLEAPSLDRSEDSSAEEGEALRGMYWLAASSGVGVGPSAGLYWVSVKIEFVVPLLLSSTESLIY